MYILYLLAQCRPFYSEMEQNLQKTRPQRKPLLSRKWRGLLGQCSKMGTWALGFYSPFPFLAYDNNLLGCSWVEPLFGYIVHL